jgi:predicted nucleic acid-binding protein
VIYLDTSSLLKLVWQERETDAVTDLINREPVVLVSSLVELESHIQLSAAYFRGRYSKAKLVRLQAELHRLLQSDPFERRSLSGAVFDLAQKQHRQSEKRTFCRTLDRLHLAAMQELGLSRLITNDLQQAEAARALGFNVVVPA